MSALIQTKTHHTLPLGLQQLHRPAVRRALGTVRGRRADRGGSGGAPVPVPPALHRRRGSRRAGSRDDARTGRRSHEPHHDGSELVRPRAPGGARRRGGRSPARAARRRRPTRSRSATSATASRAASRRLDAETDDGVWWRATFPVCEPGDAYRWLLSGGAAGYTWLNGTGVVAHDVPDADDFVLSLDPGGPGLAPALGRLRDLPRPLRRRAGAASTPPEWAVRRGWDELPDRPRPDTPREWFGGDLRGIEQRLDHIEQLGANVLYLTPDLPGRAARTATTRRASSTSTRCSAATTRSPRSRTPPTRAGCASSAT